MQQENETIKTKEQTLIELNQILETINKKQEPILHKTKITEKKELELELKQLKADKRKIDGKDNAMKRLQHEFKTLEFHRQSKLMQRNPKHPDFKRDFKDEEQNEELNEEPTVVPMQSRNIILVKVEEQRQKAKELYLQEQIILEKFLENDDPNLPSWWFMLESNIKFYGIRDKLFYNKPINEQAFEKEKINDLSLLKKDFLNETDNGEHFKKTVNRIVNESDLKEHEKQKQKLGENCEMLLGDHLTPTQLQMFNESKLILKEYTGAPIKSKKIKEKYKQLVNNLSTIYAETGFEIHKYMSFCNFFKTSEIIINKFGKINSVKIQEIQLFDKFNQDLKEVTIAISTEKKIIQNNISNAKTRLIKEIQRIEKENTIFRQTGKFFKKWSDLIEEEKKDRIDSYSEYYVRRILNMESVTNNMEDLIINLSTLLNTCILNKEIKYKDLKWNQKLGCIYNVNFILYDLNQQKFEIAIPNENKANSQKKPSMRTQFQSPEMDKKLNDMILRSLINTVDIKKEVLLEDIKKNFSLTRILLNDKIFILKRIDIIRTVIKSNS